LLPNICIQANVCFRIFAYKRLIASNYIGKPFHRSLILGLKPVLFASKQRNICFIFAYITSNRIFAVHSILLNRLDRPEVLALSLWAI
jgi:hypothetical protein